MLSTGTRHRLVLVGQLVLSLTPFGALGVGVLWYLRVAPCLEAPDREAPCLCMGEKGRRLGDPIVQKVERARRGTGAYPARLELVAPEAGPHGNDGAPIWSFEADARAFRLRYDCNWANGGRVFEYDSRVGGWVEIVKD